ncbi:MAG: DUF4337 domain-containing protein [Deltaproteobacteria bacterium]|nr:DUF4337 domain-containing protein [Deltaproteobacteria bacterium]
MSEVELPNPEELEEIKGKAFTRHVALTTAIFAVLLAISSLGGSQAMKEMLLSQQQASDQWAFYQAKVIREHLYRGNKERLELDLLEKESLKPEVKKRYEERLKQLTAEETRYATDKQGIKEKAEHLEHERDLYRGKDPYFEYAEVLLQIAIVLASIAILAHSRLMFGFSLVSATLGALMAANGFLMLVRLPFFGH